MDTTPSEVRKLNFDDYSTAKHLEHAAQQARARNYQDFLIVDVDAHHYENESYKEVFQYIESPVIRHDVIDSVAAARPLRHAQHIGRQSKSRRPHHPLQLAPAAEGAAGRPASRHRHDARMDGRDGRRLRLPVPDADAVPRPASAGRDRGGAVPRL